MEKEKERRASRDKRKNSVCEEASEPQTSVKLDGEAKKGNRPHWKVWGVLIAVDSVTHPTHSSHLFIFPLVTPSDSVVRRSISQQKTGVSVTIDDPVRTTRQPSPPHGKVSNIIHVTNLVGL